MDMVSPTSQSLQTHDGQPHATVTGFVNSVDRVKKQFTIRVVQNVLEREITTHINVIACMDSSARMRYRKRALPQIGNFISFMGSVLFFEDDVAFVHVDDVGFVLSF